MADNYNTMKLKIIFFVSLILFFTGSIFFIPPVTADHSTCDPDSYTHYPNVGTDTQSCNDLLDWWEIFDETEISDNIPLSSEQGIDYRRMFMNAELFINEDVYQRAVSSGLMAYEGHTADTITYIPDGELTQTVTYDRNTAFSTSGTADFRIDRATIDEVYKPEDTTIRLYIRDSDGDVLAAYILQPHDVDDELHLEENELEEKYGLDNEDLRDGEYRLEKEYVHDVSILESHLENSYEVEVELERDNLDADSPKIGENIVLSRDEPEFRYFHEGRSAYPDLGDYIEHNYLSNYDDSYSTDDDSSIYAPAYKEENFRHDSLKDTEYTYDGIEMVFDEDGWFDFGESDRPIQFAHVNIDKIEPAVNSPDGTIGNEWSKIIDGDEGDIYVTFGASKQSIPLDGQDYTGSASIGDREWTYSYENMDYDIELEAHTPTYSEIIDVKSESDEGATKISYEEGDLPEDTTKLKANLYIHIEYNRYVSEWEQDWCIDDEGESYKCGITLEYSHTDDMYYSTEIDDSQDIKRFAQDDGPDNEDFDIQLAQFPDETRIYVDRDLSNVNTPGDDNFQETRWTNIKSEAFSNRHSIELYNEDFEHQTNYKSSIQIPRYNIGDNRNPTVERLLSNGITKDMDVEFNLKALGDFGDDNSINIEIEDTEIGTYSINGGNRNEFERIVENEDITDISEGNEELEFKFEIENSNYNKNENPPLIDYDVTVDVNEPIQNFSSRWNYLTVRDSRWDVIYEAPQDCDSLWQADCFQYSGLPPENSDTHANFPSGVLPIHTHLAPTTNSLQTNARHDHIGYNVEVIEESQVYNELEAPLYSPYCPRDLRRDDNERICGISNSILADKDIEYEMLYGDLETTAPLEERLSGPEELQKLISAPSLFETNEKLDYRPIIEDRTLEFNEASEFELITEYRLDNFAISGNSTWTYNKLENNEERVAHETRMQSEIIPKDDLTEEKVEDIEPHLPANNEIKTADELDDDEYQLKIRLMDNSRHPISTVDRNTNEKINVERANKETRSVMDIDLGAVDAIYSIDGSDVTIGASEEVDTNQDGIAYMTIHAHPNDIDGDASIDTQFNTQEDWWNLPSNTRLLTDSDYEAIVKAEEIEDDAESSENPYITLIISLLTIIGSTFFVLAMALRVYPWSDTTTMDLVYTATDPFREQLVTLIQYLFVILVFTFILVYFTLTIVSGLN